MTSDKKWCIVHGMSLYYERTMSYLDLARRPWFVTPGPSLPGNNDISRKNLRVPSPPSAGPS